MKNKAAYLLLLVCVLNFHALAQKTTVKNDSRQLIKDNAINLAVEISREANKIADASQRIGIKIEAVKILTDFQKDVAVQTLISSWQDVSVALETEENSYSPLFRQRSEIIRLAEKHAPPKAAEWKKQIEEQQPKNKETDKAEQTSRQKADAILSSAISKAAVTPQAAVSEALSSLYKTEKMSLKFVELFTLLEEKNQLEPLENLKKGLLEYTTTRASSDVKDLGLVMSLISSGKINSTVEQNILVAFLLNSAKQILNPQTTNGKSPDELSEIYTFAQVFLRPILARYSPQNLSVLVSLLKEFSTFLPPEKIQNPIYNPEEVEKQIDDAMKISGTKERDNQLSKIVLWLLSGGLRTAENSLSWAKKAIFEISDSDAKQKLNDFIKIVEIENAVKDKNFSEAEKKAVRISTTEYRAWALMSLGKLQETNSVTAQNLYFDAMQNLQKAAASAYKAQLGLYLASYQTKNNPQTFLEIFSEAIKFSNQVRDTEEKLDWQKALYFSANFNEQIYFTSEDLRTLRLEDLEIPSNLGDIARTDWNGLFQLSQNINDKNFRFSFQLLMAKTVLKDFAKQTAKL